MNNKFCKIEENIWSSDPSIFSTSIDHEAIRNLCSMKGCDIEGTKWPVRYNTSHVRSEMQQARHRARNRDNNNNNNNNNSSNNNNNNNNVESIDYPLVAETM